MWNAMYESSRQENVRVEKNGSWNAQSLLNLYEQHTRRRDNDKLRVGLSGVWILTEQDFFFFPSKPSIPAFGVYPAYFWINVVFISRGNASAAWKGVIFEDQNIANIMWTIYSLTEICSLLWQYFMFSEQNYIRHRSYALPYKALTPFSSRT